MIHLSQNGLFSVTEVIFKSTAEIEPVDLDMHQISGFPTDHSLALGDWFRLYAFHLSPTPPKKKKGKRKNKWRTDSGYELPWNDVRGIRLKVLLKFRKSQAGSFFSAKWKVSFNDLGFAGVSPTQLIGRPIHETKSKYGLVRIGPLFEARVRDAPSEPLMFVWPRRKFVPLISSVRTRLNLWLTHLSINFAKYGQIWPNMALAFTWLD